MIPTADEPGDVVLYRHDCGEPAGTQRLLLLHGLANAATVWNDFLPRVSPEHQVWSADLPWRGDQIASIAPLHAGGGLLDSVRAAVCGIGGEHKVVVAHSFSANLLLALLDAETRAGLDPLRRYGIDKLVLVSPFYRRRPADFDWDAMAHFMNDFHEIMAEGLRVTARGRVSEDVLLDMAYRVRERVGAYGWSGFFETYLRTPWLELEAIDVECLVVTGSEDFAAVPAEAAALAEDLPSARLEVLDGCGHFPMVTAPDRFASTLSRFLDRSPSQSATREVLEMNR